MVVQSLSASSLEAKGRRIPKTVRLGLRARLVGGRGAQCAPGFRLRNGAGAMAQVQLRTPIHAEKQTDSRIGQARRALPAGGNSRRAPLRLPGDVLLIGPASVRIRVTTDPGGLH